MTSFNSAIQRFKAFALNGTRTTITENADTGRASLTLGFPPETEGFGSQPPLRTDINGALHGIDVGVIAAFFGKIWKFNAALSANANGYPQGALVVGDDNETPWLSLSDDNTVNPNTPAQTAWIAIATRAWVLAKNYITLDDLPSIPKGLGHSGQTYQSRTYDTDYTNETDAPIWVSAWFDITSGAKGMIITVNGMEVSRNQAPDAGDGGSCNAIVPVGSTWRVSISGAGAAGVNVVALTQ